MWSLAIMDFFYHSRRWLKVLACFLMNMNDGKIYSFFLVMYSIGTSTLSVYIYII